MPVATALGMIFALWLAVGAACLGWGRLLLRPLLPKAASDQPAASLFWAGFSLLLGLLQLWHLFLPVDWRATAALLGGGIAAGFLPGSFRLPRSQTPGRGLIFLFLALWLAYRGLDFPRNYDSGLYHFSSIRWINEYPIVPGLANLHERLGFNQGYFLFVALLNVHPFFNEGYHVAGSLLWFVLAAPLLAAGFAVLQAPRTAGVTAITQTLLLPAVVAQALAGDISSPTPDLAVFAVGVAAFTMMAQWLEDDRKDESTRRASALILVVLLATGCIVKLSFTAFGLSVAGVLLFATWRDSTSAAPAGVRWLSLTLVVVANCWGVPGALHGIVLSGYPAFPSTLLAWPVDWRLPLADAQATTDWIRSWARTPGVHPREVLGSWDWLGPWWARTTALPGVYLPLLATAAGGLGLGASLLRSRPRVDAGPLRQWLLPFVPLMAGLTFWFFTAPDPRFASWLFWLLAAWTLACTGLLLKGTGRIPLPRLFAWVALGATLAVIVFGAASWWRPGRHGFDSLPVIATREFTTKSGLKILLPAHDQEVRLWDAPLPSAPLPKPGLELRGADFRAGFRTAADPSAPAH